MGSYRVQNNSRSPWQSNLKMNKDKDGVHLVFRILERYPKTCLASTLSFLISLWVVTFLLLAVGYDIAPFVLDFIPIQIQDSVWHLRASTVLKWHTGKRKDFMDHRRYIHYGGWDPQFVKYIEVDLFYKMDENILTRENLNKIKKIEDDIVSVKDYEYYFEKPISLLSFFQTNATYNNEKITKILEYYMRRGNKKEKMIIAQSLPNSFEIKPGQKNAYTNLLRTSLISFPKYADKVIILDEILKKHWQIAQRSGDYEFAYYNTKLYYDDLAAQSSKDTLFTVGSFIFIFVVLLFHTRSIPVTTAAIFGILSSVLGGNLIYRVVFDQRYIGVFHCISIFIVLGIGVDDIFVLFDVWHDSFRSEKLQLPSHAFRMQLVFRKAMFPVFITSLTSMLAFFVNVICEIPIISTFGLFTGLVVLFNYITVITFFPCVLINLQFFYEWLHNRQLCTIFVPSWSIVNDESNREGKPLRRMAYLFDYYFRVLQIRGVATLFIFISLTVSAVFIWRTTMLEPSKSTTEFFTRGTNYYAAMKFDEEFKKDTPLQLDIIWGLRLMNRSMCHKHDFRCEGTIQFNDQLDLNLWKAQTELYKFAHYLKFIKERDKELRIHRENGRNAISFFLVDMHDDMLYQNMNNKSGCKDGKPLDLTMPIGEIKVKRLRMCRPDLYGTEDLANRLQLDEWYDRNFETAHNYWKQNSAPGINVLKTSQVRKFTFKDATMLLIPRLHGSKELKYKYFHNYGGRLKAIGLYIKLNLTQTSDNFFSGIHVRQNWERLVEKQNSRFTLGLGKAFQCMSQPFPKSPINIWEWYDIQEKLWNNAHTGILLGVLAVAIPILLFATANIVLTIIGGTCLCCVTATVVAMAQLTGWTLGITESMNFAMVAGLSVDHIVHFIEAYSRSKAASKEEKTRDMLVQMGGAVTSGMVSTVGATSFLFGAKVVFFIQFGAFMATTIGSAFCFSLFLLAPLLISCGPTGNVGSFHSFFKSWETLYGESYDMDSKFRR